jgi:soluble lytic murein transglycosylase-like protein
VADPLDPVQNLHGGARYLRHLLKRYDNDVSLALAAYNAGEAAVARHGRQIPPYRETSNYVPRVLGFYRKYRAESL